MEDIRNSLQQAFAILSRIPVSGDAVDLMAAARQALRAAFQAAEVKHDDATETSEQK